MQVTASVLGLDVARVAHGDAALAGRQGDQRRVGGVAELGEHAVRRGGRAGGGGVELRASTASMAGSPVDDAGRERLVVLKYGRFAGEAAGQQQRAESESRHGRDGTRARSVRGRDRRKSSAARRSACGRVRSPPPTTTPGGREHGVVVGGWQSDSHRQRLTSARAADVITATVDDGAGREIQRATSIEDTTLAA